jgi:hypothetical protein
MYLKPEDPLERQRFVRPLSPKNLAMTKFILNELAETERSYNQLLKLIQDVSIIVTFVALLFNQLNRDT